MKGVGDEMMQFDLLHLGGGRKVGADKEMDDKSTVQSSYLLLPVRARVVVALARTSTQLLLKENIYEIGPVSSSRIHTPHSRIDSGGA